MATLRTLVLTLCAAVTVDAHGLLVTPAPRDGTNQAGNNKGRGRGPCGQGDQLNTKNAPAATVNAGATMQVEWDCRIGHGGTCEISVSTEQVATGAGQGTPGAGSFVDVADGPFACCAQRGNEQKTVTIPANAAGGDAVLAWMWTGDGPYFDCSDITINAAEPPSTNQGTTTGGGGGIGPNDEQVSNALITAAAIIYGILFLFVLYYCFYCKSKENMNVAGTGPNGGHTGEDSINECYDSCISCAPYAGPGLTLILMASQTGFGVVTLAVLKTQLDDAHGWSKHAANIRLAHVAASTVIAGFGTLGAMLTAGYKTCSTLSEQALGCWRTLGWKLLALLFSLVLIGFIADASDYKMMEDAGDASSKHKFVVYIVLVELVLTMANLVNALGLARHETSWEDFKYRQEELEATAGAYGGQNYGREPYFASGSAYGGAFNTGPPTGPRGGYAPAAPGRPPRAAPGKPPPPRNVPGA